MFQSDSKIYCLYFKIQTQNATNRKNHFARNSLVWPYRKMSYRISQLCLTHQKRMMGNSIPRFTTTRHNKGSNSIPPLPTPPVSCHHPPHDYCCFRIRKRKEYLQQSHLRKQLCDYWVHVYWFEATSVALLITLPTGVRVTRCCCSRQDEHLMARTASSATRFTTTEVMSFPFNP